MNKYLLLLVFTVLCTGISAQDTWFGEKYHNFAYIRMLRVEQKIVKKSKADTIFVIFFAAHSHDNSIKNRVLWYHKKDKIIAYKISPLWNHKYVIADSSNYFVDDSISNYYPCSNTKKCFGKSGWDMMTIYIKGKYVGCITVDQECLLETSHRNNSLGNLLKHDITLLRETIPKWIILHTCSIK